MVEKIFFRTNCLENKTLEDIAHENPEYIKIYVNIKSVNNKTTLSLSKDHGDILYIVSNKNYDNIQQYFEKYYDNTNIVLKKTVDFKDTTEIKKSKQQNLFSFFEPK